MLPPDHRLTPPEVVELLDEPFILGALMAYHQGKSNLHGYPECLEDSAYHQNYARHYQDLLYKPRRRSDLPRSLEADEVRHLMQNPLALKTLADFWQAEADADIYGYPEYSQPDADRAKMYRDELERLRRLVEAENES